MYLLTDIFKNSFQTIPMTPPFIYFYRQRDLLKARRSLRETLSEKLNSNLIIDTLGALSPGLSFACRHLYIFRYGNLPSDLQEFDTFKWLDETLIFKNALARHLALVLNLERRGLGQIGTVQGVRRINGNLENQSSPFIQFFWGLTASETVKLSYLSFFLNNAWQLNPSDVLLGFYKSLSQRIIIMLVDGWFVSHLSLEKRKLLSRDGSGATDGCHLSFRSPGFVLTEDNVTTMGGTIKQIYSGVAPRN